MEFRGAFLTLIEEGRKRKANVLGSRSARVLMVTQDNERNAFDQKPLEYELLNT